MDSSIQIMIICCNEERQVFQKQQMKDLELPFSIVQGYTPAASKDYIAEKHPKNPEPDVQICCLRSHIGAIDSFVKQFPTKQYCIIMEDDVVLTRTFLKELESIIQLWGTKEIDIVSLGYLNPKTKFKCKQTDGVLGWDIDDLIWGTQCYIVKRAYAEELATLSLETNTNNLFKVLRAKHMYSNKELRLYADVVITGFGRHGFVWPPIAIENEEFSSIITPQHKNKDRCCFDFNLRKREDFYTPIDLSNRITNPYVINLSHRNDRWDETQQEFKRLHLIPQRIDAVYMKENGAAGCLESHIRALQEGQKTNLPVWISEDDVKFIQPKYKVVHLIDAFLKSDGDILCIANNTRYAAHHNDLFHAVIETQTTASYIIKPSFLPVLLQLWEEINECRKKGTTHFTYHLLKKTDRMGLHDFTSCDVCWKVLQHYYKFLIPAEQYAIQRKSYSDITNCVQDYYGDTR